MRITVDVYIGRVTGDLVYITMLRPESEPMESDGFDIEREAHLLKRAHEAIKEAIENINSSLEPHPAYGGA